MYFKPFFGGMDLTLSYSEGRLIIRTVRGVADDDGEDGVFFIGEDSGRLRPPVLTNDVLGFSEVVKYDFVF